MLLNVLSSTHGYGPWDQLTMYSHTVTCWSVSFDSRDRAELSSPTPHQAPTPPFFPTIVITGRPYRALTSSSTGNTGQLTATTDSATKSSVWRNVHPYFSSAEKTTNKQAAPQCTWRRRRACTCRKIQSKKTNTHSVDWQC